jgi:hypothetical protein
MPTSLAHRLHLDRRLAAAITRAEGPRRPPRTSQSQRDRVAGQIVRDIALPRFLVWHSYLASRKPTQASVTKAMRHMRGVVLYRYAQWAAAQGLPLPTAHTPPAWAKPSALHVQRAEQQQPSNQKPGTDKWLNPDAYPTPDDAAAAWWDEMGWDAGIPPDAWAAATPEQRQQWQDEALASVSVDLDFQDWIGNTVLNDMQVLQLLESYWNGQTTMFAGQETIGEMGIAGDFNLVDPFANDFLRYQAGLFVTRIDEKTREQLANALWSGWGGEADQGVGPFGVDQLARYVQGVMNAWENGLSGMSYARALLIANTETARAETFGQFIAMLGSGVQQKIWVVTAGACQICVVQAEQGPVPIRDQFPNGDMAPPGHPSCRCSLSPFVDTTKPFNPNDWAYAPDPTQMQRLFQDPSFAQWPNQVANLNDPALQLTPPPPTALGGFGQLQYGDLPSALQQVISPDAFASNYTDAWNVMLQSVGQAVNQAVSADTSVKVAEETAATGGGADPGKVLTLDDILAGETPPDLADFSSQLRSTLDDAIGQMQDGLAGLDDTTGNAGE